MSAAPCVNPPSPLDEKHRISLVGEEGGAEAALLHEVVQPGLVLQLLLLQLVLEAGLEGGVQQVPQVLYLQPAAAAAGPKRRRSVRVFGGEVMPDAVGGGV